MKTDFLSFLSAKFQRLRDFCSSETQPNFVLPPKHFQNATTRDFNYF